MKIKNILLIPGLAITALCYQSSLQAESPTPVAPPEAAGPKFGPEDGAAGGSDRGEKAPRQNMEERLTHLKEALALTPEQEVKIRDIFKAEREKKRAERETSKAAPPTKEDRKKMMGETRDRLNGLIEGVLTPEQKTKFEALKARKLAGKNKPETTLPKPDAAETTSPKP